MAIPFIVHDVARSIYEYAGKDGLPNFEDLPPTVQISYIEEAEAALMMALSDTLKPKNG